MKDEEKRIFIKIHNELINALSTVEDEMRAELCDLSDYFYYCANFNSCIISKTY